MASRYVWETVPRSKKADNLSMLEFVRMMEKAGLAKWADDDLAWFEDHRQSRQFQAQYLDKLTRFREDLYSHEKVNMDSTVERLRRADDSKNNSKLKNSRKPKNESADDLLLVTQEMNPARHMKLQQMKMERIRKQKRPKTPPKLDPLEGRQLIEPFKDVRECKSAPDNKEKSTGNVDTRVPSSESLPNLSPRYSVNTGDQKTKVLTDLQKLLHPSSSIPNVGRRAVKEPDRLLPLQLDARNQTQERSSNTFIKQMSMHKKHPRTKLYQGSPHKLSLSQTIDKVELEPDSFNYHLRSSLDSLLDKVARAQHTQSIYAPATTPVCSEDETDSGGSNGKFGSGSSLPVVKQLVKYRLYDKDKHRNKPEFLNYVKRRRKERMCLKCQNRNKNFEAREKFMDEMSSACHACNEMALPKFKQENLTPESFITIQTSGKKCELANESDTSSDSANTLEELSPRKKIVVQMPDIVLRPSSPVEGSCNGKLYRSLKQNEYRKKEVKDLLEDVKELNERTEMLAEYIKQEESSVT